jgi:2-polyprenyl-6-methoxyphenol hydroxylase-like FAD-dependent oxidoreductase
MNIVTSSGMEEHDVVIVGARCAGSALAIGLARQGWDVLLVDHASFPSTTISTHGLWPNGLARLEALGVLDTLRAEHELPLYESRIRGLGHEIVGAFTPIDGFDRAAAPRRIVLDKAGVDTALAAGAKERFGKRVVRLLGAGTEEEPVHGVVLEDGERIGARWVFGADGRGSTIAKLLGVPKERPMRGELAISYAYWEGILNDGYGHMQIEYDRVLNKVPVEDDLHMLIANGPPELTTGTSAERERKYLELIRRFPETLEPAALERARMVGRVAVAPESLMRGFFRRSSGPGWALLGDAGHFKHPGTAQGIGDAVEQAHYIVGALNDAEASLDTYEAWRDERAEEHYEYSFAWGHFPRPGTGEVLFRGWASEADAGQDLRDCFSRLVEPSQLNSKERLERWFGSQPSPSSEPSPAQGGGG